MTKRAVLKKVKEAYPGAFELPKPKLRLVENAIVFASQLAGAGDILTDTEHKDLMKKLTGSEKLSSGQKLRAYRLRESFSQVDLAKRAGIPQANISAMEAGSRPIGIQTAKKLAQALGCDFRLLV